MVYGYMHFYDLIKYFAMRSCVIEYVSTYTKTFYYGKTSAALPHNNLNMSSWNWIDYKLSLFMEDEYNNEQFIPFQSISHIICETYLL